jgi:hypothetical protein
MPTQILNELIHLTQRWALRQPYDAVRAAALRRQLLLHNHEHYRSHISAYRRLCEEEKLTHLDSLEPITERLMSTDDLFKSYQPRWLDNHEFDRMTAWLSELHHRPIALDTTQITSISEWISALRGAGLAPVYSSGTSGMLSFVPRDQANLALLKTANTAYLIALLSYNKLGTRLQRTAVKAAATWLQPPTFERFVRALSPRGFDGAFLDFRGGGTGMQAIGHEAAAAFSRQIFLYNATLPPEALRVLARGPRNQAEQTLLQQLQNETITRKAENYARFADELRQSSQAGRRVFLFGAPYQLKELCEQITASGSAVQLHPESLLLFGGGWKSFAGEALAREALLTLISEQLGLDATRIIEGYAMTEINVMSIRCEHGRFHVPPLVEPVIFNEALLPMRGSDVRGIYGFLDPLAIAYPGFIITGDVVHLVDQECACGLNGPAILEIGRARQRDIKGCGGVLASVRA